MHASNKCGGTAGQAVGTQLRDPRPFAGQMAPDAPPASTRFSQCAGRLEARVMHFGHVIDRLTVLADRLGGSYPEPGSNGNAKINGASNSVAAVIENSLDIFDGVAERAEQVLQRLEAL